MTLSNLVEATEEQKAQEQNNQSNQWIHRDRKVRIIECIDEILHFFLIRAIQIDFGDFSAEQREQVHMTLIEMYHSLANSFTELVEIKIKSRMVQKHERFLALVKEEDEIDEERVPFHLRLCLR